MVYNMKAYPIKPSNVLSIWTRVFQQVIEIKFFTIWYLVTCRFIPLGNGTVSYNIPSGSPSPLLDTVATFSCNTNYYRDGPSSAKCQTSGGWSQRTPTCRLSNKIA